jgi:hypothetical protein
MGGAALPMLAPQGRPPLFLQFVEEEPPDTRGPVCCISNIPGDNP